MRSSSRLRRAISAACSAGNGISGVVTVVVGGMVPLAAPRQLRRMEGWMPSSAATCISGRPLLSSRATASRLNSSVNIRRVFVIQHLLAPGGAYQRCPPNRGKINTVGTHTRLRRSAE